jgi:formate hydrogenlyase subunit 4
MNQLILNTILPGIIQLAIILLVSPLIIGIIRKIKAFFQNRTGASIFQPYQTLFKQFKKEVVISSAASWITPAMPYILFSTTLAAALLVPTFMIIAPLSGLGDVLIVIYLLALGSFFLALAGLDQGSAFGGMGSSRHMTIASLAEPAMILSIFAVGMNSSSTNISQIISQGTVTEFFLNPLYVFSFLALFIVMLAETSRIPIDNPATHLELTMIHEAMILDYSGRYLALIEWSSAIKLMLFLTLLGNIFFPVGIITSFTIFGALIAIIIFIIKLLFFASVIAIIESSMAKFRLFRVPDLLWIAFMLSLLGIIIHFANI